MTTEEISIEETNILRAKIGLPPIPLEEEKPQDQKKDLSIEETNKLRISLGLNPIEIKSVDIEHENYQDLQKEKEKQKRDEEFKQRLQIAKDKNDRKRKIAENKLSYDDEEISTDSWLDSLKIKKPKVVEKSKPVDSELYQEVVGEISHSNKELRDLKDNEILTLNDNDVLDENDQLSNERLKAQAKLSKDMKERNKVRDIKGGKYYSAPNEDEDEGFVRLDGSEIKFDQKEEPVVKDGKNKINFELFDMLDEPQKAKKTTKMKKIKKKENNKRVKDDSISVQSVKLQPIFDEEDDIEESLSLQRKLKQQSRKFLKPEDIAKEIRQFQRIDQEELVENLTSQNDGMLFDQMDDFLSNLSTRPEADGNDHESDTKVDLPKNSEVVESLILPKIPESKDEFSNSSSSTSTKTVKPGNGLGLTLRYLRENNLIKETSETVRKRSKVLSQAEELKQKMKKQEEIVKKELESDGNYQQLSGIEKENYFRSKLDDYLQANDSSGDFFENYQPSIHLTYKDRKGNTLSTKEAFKQLSSEYHGTSKTHIKKDKSKFKKKR